ncbi:MAG TPA: ABC transporter permease subunit, partial [Planctomycetaceae bacterium]
MWSYLVRRLLLMIPTLFGVTVVSFVIMQLAPGDPLLTQVDSGGNTGQSTQTREAFLLQKRDLKLDKPLLLNFNDFRDYSSSVAAACYFLGHTPAETSVELARLADNPADPASRGRLDLLKSLPIKGLEERLDSPDQRDALAVAVLAHLRVFCEDTGSHGVPAAIAVLESDADLHEKIGAIRALEYMVPEPFRYTYSRTPLASETPLVETTWRVWWQRAQKKFEPLDGDRRQVLQGRIKQLVAETDRQNLFDELEKFEREDSPYFVNVLLAADTPLNEKAIAAMFLLLYNGKPLAVDVPLTAKPQQVAEVSDNWLAHYEARRAEYQPSLPAKLWHVAADTQYAHMVWRLATFNFGRSALKTREPVSEKLWEAFKISAPLMLMSELVIYFVAVPLGVLCAVKRGRFTDRAISLGLFVLYSIPPVVAGMLFLLFLCYGSYMRRIFPMQRLHSDAAESFNTAKWTLDYLWHAFLPVTCLSLFS